MNDPYGRPLLPAQQQMNGSTSNMVRPPSQQTPPSAQQQTGQQLGQQGVPVTPNGNTQQQQQESPGFFKRLFGGGANGTASATASSNASPVSVPHEAHTANCLPSKALTPEEAEQLRNRQMPPSKFSCLNSNATAAATPGAPPNGTQTGMNGGDPAAGQFPPPPLTTPGLAGPPPETSRLGPYLRFGGYDPTSRMWNASVLMVIHQAFTTQPPKLLFRDVDLPGGEATVTAIHLDHYQGWNFWRFNLVVECGLKERCVEYSVQLSTDHVFTQPPRYRVLVPGVAQKWRWGFFSCNGFDEPEKADKVGGIQPLWRDVMYCHTKAPFHAMIGGGDQLYNDPVWQSPALEAWCRLPEPKTRVQHPFTQDMVNQVFDFYFNAYAKHWNQPIFKDALASIPMIMTWDDHDIFDGWGSYPDFLQSCPVFQGIYYVARKFYALFQQHTTVERVSTDNNVFGEFGWNQLTCMGNSTALLVIDSRSERTLTQVVRPASWAMIQDRLARLPPTIRHVVVIATVPVVYPEIPAAESTLRCIQDCSCVCKGKGARSRYGMVNLLQKTGLADSLLNQFGTIDILDDIQDHWSAAVHKAEKLGMVHMMQALSLARGFRFSLVSGDVHVAAMGRLVSKHHWNLKTDHRYIPQIVSSAIANLPPPPTVVKALNAAGGKSKVDEHTREMMSPIFGHKKCLFASRNWLLATEKPITPGSSVADGGLVYQFRIEPEDGLPDQRPLTFEVSVPVLELHHMPKLHFPHSHLAVTASPPTAAAPVPQDYYGSPYSQAPTLSANTGVASTHNTDTQATGPGAVPIRAAYGATKYPLHEGHPQQMAGQQQYMPHWSQMGGGSQPSAPGTYPPPPQQQQQWSQQGVAPNGGYTNQVPANEQAGGYAQQAASQQNGSYAQNGSYVQQQAGGGGYAMPQQQQQQNGYGSYANQQMAPQQQQAGGYGNAPNAYNNQQQGGSYSAQAPQQQYGQTQQQQQYGGGVQGMRPQVPVR